MSKKWRTYWTFQVIGWGSFCLINTFFAFSFDKLDDKFFYRLLIFLFLGILISHIMREVITRVGILQKNLKRQVVLFVTLTFFMALVASYLRLEGVERLNLLSGDEVLLLSRPDVKYWVSKLVLVLSSGFSFFILFFIWNLIYFMYHYVTKSRKQQLDTLRLESLVKELELQTIKAHINPHFIFNSLNSIRALVDENPQRARRAVTELSNILRSSMQSEKMETVSLEKELNIVKDYLALENMRFEDRLKIEYQIDEDTLDQPVPPMMLQTLVENAIKHGISKQINGGVVKVISDFKENYHELVVQNTGQLNGKVNTEGFGLSSTTNRLSLLYGDKAKFDIKQINGSLVEAKVLIPLTNV
ncbi:MAG TPA: histidine kinase [Chitinophagaceae bacterium]|nr:histidine kinase [Chitinophagaceae bacterium]